MSGISFRFIQFVARQLIHSVSPELLDQVLFPVSRSKSDHEQMNRCDRLRYTVVVVSPDPIIPEILFDM